MDVFIVAMVVVDAPLMHEVDVFVDVVNLRAGRIDMHLAAGDAMTGHAVSLRCGMGFANSVIGIFRHAPPALDGHPTAGGGGVGGLYERGIALRGVAPDRGDRAIAAP